MSNSIQNKSGLHRYQSLLPASIFAILAIALSAAVQIPTSGTTQAALRLGAVGLGQIFWATTLLICIIRGNIYAYNNISEDGYGMIGYNIVKWGGVIVFLFFDAFLLERAYEQYFIFAR